MHSLNHDTDANSPLTSGWNSHHPPLIWTVVANAAAIESARPEHRVELHALSVILVMIVALLAIDVDTRRRNPMSARGRLVAILTVLLVLPALCTTTGRMIGWAADAITSTVPAPVIEPAPEPPGPRPSSPTAPAPFRSISDRF